MNKTLTITVLLLLPTLLLAGTIGPIAKQEIKTTPGAARSHETAPDMAITGPTANSESYTMKMNTGVIATLEMSSSGSYSLIGIINLPVVNVTPMSPLETETEPPVITEYALFQNYPNPFNPVTEIRFDLPKATNVQLKILNSLGQEVATLIDEARQAGSYRVMWDAGGMASGVYLYRLKAGSFVETKKMILMR